MNKKDAEENKYQLSIDFPDRLFVILPVICNKRNLIGTGVFSDNRTLKSAVFTQVKLDMNSCKKLINKYQNPPIKKEQKCV